MSRVMLPKSGIPARERRAGDLRASPLTVPPSSYQGAMRALVSAL